VEALGSHLAEFADFSEKKIIFEKFVEFYLTQNEGFARLSYNILTKSGRAIGNLRFPVESRWNPAFAGCPVGDFVG